MMIEYYRELITELLPQINDVLKLHEIYVDMLVYVESKKDGGNDE